MSILTLEQKRDSFLAHGHLFEQACDTPGCGRFIKNGELFIVLKWMKRTDGLQCMLGRIPAKVRCMVCEREINPPKEVVKVQNAGRSAKKVSQEVASSVSINVLVRKIVMRALKNAPNGILPTTLFGLLRKKKATRELPKKEISLTLRGMKKLKMFRKKGGVFILPKEKKKRNKKVA